VRSLEDSLWVSRSNPTERELITEEWIKLGILPINGSYYLPYQRGGNYYEPSSGIGEPGDVNIIQGQRSIEADGSVLLFFGEVY